MLNSYITESTMVSQTTRDKGRRSNRTERTKMPDMPDFSLKELEEATEDSDNDDHHDKLEEKKMAEILVKLQVAKQKAVESKKVI